MIAFVLLCGSVLAASPVGDDRAPIPDATAADLAAYEKAKAKTGRDADAQVRLALWCEAHGMSAERIKHLARAVIADPTNASARGLMGLVAFGGKWARPSDVADKVKTDPALAAATAEYLKRRVKAADTAEAQSKLAVWCEENGLPGQAVAHFRRVIALDPRREGAWKRLGYKKQPNGRWALPAQVAEAKAEADAQKQADRYWHPRLERWRAEREGKNKTLREAAETALAEVSDPRAVPSVWLVFAKGNDARQQLAVRLLGQIDAPSSTQSLALIALSGTSAEARRHATEILRRRDPRDYGSLLANLMRKPIKYKYTPVGGPGQTGTLLVEGRQHNTARRYTPPQMPDIDGLIRGPRYVAWVSDADGLPVLVLVNRVSSHTASDQAYVAQDGSFVITGQWAAEFGSQTAGQNALSNDVARQISQNPGNVAHILDAKKDKHPHLNGLGGLTGSANPGFLALAESGAFSSNQPGSTNVFEIGRAVVETEHAARDAQQQLESDVRSIESYNMSIDELNRRVVDLINSASGQHLDPDPEKCQRWAIDQLGIAFVSTPDVPKPTLVEDAPLNYRLPPLVGMLDGPEGYVTRPSFSRSCFGKGTIVHTQSGQMAIETVRAGDLILAQDLKAGALSFRPVVTAYHNPPSATLKVAFEGGESVVATGIHRFWKAGRGWAMARDLKVGDMIRTIGGTARVASVGDDATQPVFNLELADGQNFFVGESGLLVHDNSLVRPEPKTFDSAPGLATLGGREP